MSSNLCGCCSHMLFGRKSACYSWLCTGIGMLPTLGCLASTGVQSEDETTSASGIVLALNLLPIRQETQPKEPRLRVLSQQRRGVPKPDDVRIRPGHIHCAAPHGSRQHDRFRPSHALPGGGAPVVALLWTVPVACRWSET